MSARLLWLAATVAVSLAAGTAWVVRDARAGRRGAQANEESTPALWGARSDRTGAPGTTAPAPPPAPPPPLLAAAPGPVAPTGGVAARAATAGGPGLQARSVGPGEQALRARIEPIAARHPGVEIVFVSCEAGDCRARTEARDPRALDDFAAALRSGAAADLEVRVRERLTASHGRLFQADVRVGAAVGGAAR